MPSKRTTLPLAAAAVAVAAVLVFVVTKEPHYNVRPGAQSGNAHCGRIAENAPAKLAGHTKHATKLAGVALWGDSNIVLRCGVTDIGPISDPCFSADGVDWVIDTTRSTDSPEGDHHLWPHPGHRGHRHSLPQGTRRDPRRALGPHRADHADLGVHPVGVRTRRPRAGPVSNGGY